VKVMLEGEVGAGDEIRRIGREENSVPFSEITRLYVAKNYSKNDLASLQRLLNLAVLPESWKEHFLHRLERE
jgi:MOSC domain-containing protein YiiM